MNIVRKQMTKTDYGCMHKRVAHKYLRLYKCEACGVRGRTHLSNKSGRYIEEYLGDWQELCPQCHCDYDSFFFGSFDKGKGARKATLMDLVERIVNK